MKIAPYRKHMNTPPGAYWTSWREALSSGLGPPRGIAPATKEPTRPHPAKPFTGFRSPGERAFAAKEPVDING